MELTVRNQVNNLLNFSAVYGNVTIGEAPGYKLLEIGKYHGTAGELVQTKLDR